MIHSREALANALMFDHAYELLNARMEQGAKERNLQDAGLFVPVVVNCTFSCELFLKSMLPVDTHGHCLYNQLFVKLDAALAESIQNCVVQILNDLKGGYSKEDFVNDLIAHEKSFQAWRYFHEGKPVPQFNFEFMRTLHTCLKAIAIAEDGATRENP